MCTLPKNIQPLKGDYSAKKGGWHHHASVIQNRTLLDYVCAHFINSVMYGLTLVNNINFDFKGNFTNEIDPKT